MRAMQGNDTGLEGYYDENGMWIDTSYDAGYDYTDNSTYVDYGYDDGSYDDGYWDEYGNWVSYDQYDYSDNSTDYGYDNYTDYGDDSWDEHTSYIEELIYQARANLDDAIWMWESSQEGDWDYDHDEHHHENHTEWHSPESCPWGIFEGRSIDEFVEFFEEQAYENGESDGYGGISWYHDEDGEYAEGYYYEWSDEETGESGHSGWAWDGSTSVYWWSDNGDDTSYEIYDCDYNLIESVHASHDTVEHHPDDIEAVEHVKDVYNEGNHYYWDDGSTEFWSSDDLTWGEVYPDGYVWASHYTEDYGEYYEFEAECYGASGHYNHEGYDDEGNWVQLDSEEWDHDCEEYSAFEHFTEDVEDAEDAEEDAEESVEDDGTFEIEEVVARTQFRHFRR